MIGYHPNKDHFAQIASEMIVKRHDQIALGYSPERDDQHTDGSIGRMAACFALYACGGDYKFWARLLNPWSLGDLKPIEGERSPRQQLVHAGALIVAEIERLDRLSLKTLTPVHELNIR